MVYKSVKLGYDQAYVWMTRTPTVKSISRVSKNEAVLIRASFSFLTLETAAIRKECRQKKIKL